MDVMITRTSLATGMTEIEIETEDATMADQGMVHVTETEIVIKAEMIGEMPRCVMAAETGVTTEDE